MFKTAASKVTALSLAAACAITMSLSAGTAQARDRDALIVGGAILGGALLHGIVTANSAPRYVEDDVYVPVRRRCWKERRVVAYDDFGDAIVRRVRICR
jgi:hypothetical protein